MNKLFPKSVAANPRSQIQESIIRNFGGGWNAVEDDHAMDAKYLAESINIHRTAGTGQKIRYGSRRFTDTASIINSSIVDIVYFNGRLVTVHQNGEVGTTDSGGVVTKIWSDNIAALLPGTPDGWNATVARVSFVPIRNKLVIHNGVDKPIIINQSFAITYLQDEATGSNANVPIGKYGCVVANYHCVAGISGSPTTIYIASKGTAGTFPGDPDPNDSISIDVGAYAPAGATEIRGIAGFKTFLIVHFLGQSILIKLGVYDDNGIHTPEFPDDMPEFGLLGHRCLAVTETDILFATLGGLASAKRNLFVTSALETSMLSELVEPAYKRIIGALTDSQLLDGSFAVYDKLNHELLLFTPDGSTLVYSFQETKSLRYRAWTQYADWAWTSGCVSFLGRVFVTKTTKIYQLGNGSFANENFNADKIDDYDGHWTTGTNYVVGNIIIDTSSEKQYKCLVNHTSGPTLDDDLENHPTYWEEYIGVPIEWSMELPWISGRTPLQTKFIKALSINARGSAAYTVECYIDDLYKNEDGDVIHDPALTMEFVGNQQGGFGADATFGSGRRSNDPRLYRFPVKCKSVKFRLLGSSTRALQILSIAFLFVKLKFFR